jgi:hypothetical protein
MTAAVPGGAVVPDRAGCGRGAVALVASRRADAVKRVLSMERSVLSSVR